MFFLCKRKQPSLLVYLQNICACVFQSEWEALEIIEHKWALENVEEELMSGDLNLGAIFSQEVKSTVF